MNAVRQLRGAGLTAFIASFLALNCGEQEFNLLPVEQEDGRGGSTDGNGGFQQGEKGGVSNGGRGNAGGRGSTGGASASSGRGGMSSGQPQCEPPVCCATNEECTDKERPFCLGGVCQQCYLFGQDYKTIGCAADEVCSSSFKCVPSCAYEECPEPLKCDPQYPQCVDCVDHEDCSQNEYRKLCWRNSCVMCRTNADCSGFSTCNQFTCD